VTFDFALGQLRHLYVLMRAGHVRDFRQVAEMLLGPVIETLERHRFGEMKIPAIPGSGSDIVDWMRGHWNTCRICTFKFGPCSSPGTDVCPYCESRP
jgi:hypothetical protein